MCTGPILHEDSISTGYLSDSAVHAWIDFTVIKGNSYGLDMNEMMHTLFLFMQTKLSLSHQVEFEQKAKSALRQYYPDLFVLLN
jgi:hypothetical protein